MAKPQAPVTLTKAWVFDDPEAPGGARLERIGKQAQQIGSGDAMRSADDRAAENGLERPPFDMDELAGLLGGSGQIGNSIHTRCVKQKATDTLGRGIELREKAEMEGSDEERARFEAWTALIEDDGEGSFKERLTWAHQDFESIGWATLEVGRDAQGNIDGLWHIPSHTIRAHKDGRRFAQKRGDKLTWFKRFGIEDGDVESKRGGWTSGRLGVDQRGNELIVIRNYTPASTYYGLPDHIPALSAMAGWTAQAEFNIRFFGNQAVPSYAVVVEGADLTPELEDTIITHFKRIKGDPARTIVIPVPSVPGVSEQYQPKVRFERLSVEVKEASFRMYRQDAALEICISHGMPPYRIGWPIVGSLGGSTALEMTEIYNDSIVQPRQETWEQRLDRMLLGPKGLDISTWGLKAAELDVRNEVRDLEKARTLYELGATTPKQTAAFFGIDRDGPGAEDYISIPLAPGQSAGADIIAMRAPFAEEAAAQFAQEAAEIAALRKRVEEVIREPFREAA